MPTPKIKPQRKPKAEEMVSVPKAALCAVMLDAAIWNPYQDIKDMEDFFRDRRGKSVLYDSIKKIKRAIVAQERKGKKK